MVVKMRKWSPWTPPWTPATTAATRKFQVAVKPVKLEGLPEEHGGDEAAQKYIAIKIRWKGEPKLFQLMAPFQSKPKKELSSFMKGRGIILWDEDHWFENTCCFSIGHDSKFGPWDISFNVVSRDKMDPKTKTAVIGRVSVNLSELAWKMDSSSVEEKLPLSLQINGVSRDAILTVLFNFVEVRDGPDSLASPRLGANECKENVKARRRSMSLEEVSLDDSDELSASSTRSRLPGTVVDSDKKERWFSWTSRRFSIKRPKTREDKSDEKTQSCMNDDRIDVDAQPTTSSSMDLFSDQKPCVEAEYRDGRVGVWEEKEVVSRDGQAKLRALVFFASFDQCSDKAAGESACTVLVAVISHWLHSNGETMPSRSEFDNLIMQGSSEWRKLCEDDAYVNDFPNKHFDLETVLRAGIRPVSISHHNSFVGFFGAETFEALKGAMSFDDMWNEIGSNYGVYIVSWNDHFFVLKAEENAYYIIDTLGERLYEGCNQAYILRFDDKAVMQKHAEKGDTAQTKTETLDEEEVIICSGKECCREFIKRFLAAIPLKEVEEEEKRNGVSYVSLHHRLQIEFNYSVSTSPVSSSTSSPLSSISTSASSPLSE